MMDEKLEASTSLGRETVEAGVSPADGKNAAGTAAATATALDLNELQELSEKKLEALARDLELHLHPARSRHPRVRISWIRSQRGGGRLCLKQSA